MKLMLLVTLACLATLLGLTPDMAWANKFETIGGGVSGTSFEKFQLLRAASLMIGSIVTLIGLLSLIPKFHGHSDINTSKITLTKSLVLIAVGSVLVGLYFL
jgi:hypothetical protein